MSVALKFSSSHSRVERILQSGHHTFFKLTNMRKPKPLNHFTWLFRHRIYYLLKWHLNSQKASFQKLTTKQRRWGGGLGGVGGLRRKWDWGHTSYLNASHNYWRASVFFLFNPSAFPWEGQVTVAKNRGHELISNPDLTLQEIRHKVVFPVKSNSV